MSASVAKRLLDDVRSERTLLIDLLEELTAAESPSAHPDIHDRIRRALATMFLDVDFAVREVGRRGAARHMFARPVDRERHKPLQLVVGHYDTVWPVGTLAERPFTVDGNVIRGPGVFDMKGGIVMCLLAFRSIARLGLDLPATPVVFINADEEIGSRSSSRYIRQLARHSARALVLEPAMGDAGLIKTERKGIGRYTITVYGKAAHAGLDPEGGASAILELSHVIQTLFALNDPAAGVTVNVGTVDGGIQPNVVAPHSSCVVDVRVPTVADGERIDAAIHSLEPSTEGVRLRIDGAIGRPSMEATPRNQALWKQARALGSELGLDLAAARAGGGSDGNTTSQFTATLDGLGPVGDGAHAAHEFLYVDETLERAALLALLLAAPVLDSNARGA
jgi:glutamate carboxypeptidase